MATEARKNIGLKGKIGGVSKRFNSLNSSYNTPGPGYYLDQNNKYAKGLSAAFASKTKRTFVELNKKIVPDMCSYNSSVWNNLGCEAKFIKGGGNNLFRFLSIKSDKKPAFQSGTSRFFDNKGITI